MRSGVARNSQPLAGLASLWRIFSKAAKAKGMKPKTEPLAGMESPAAKAKQMKPQTETEIIINGDIRLSTPMGPREILRCILAIPSVLEFPGVD